MFIKMKVAGLSIDPFTNAPIVVLKDSEEKKSLPIWIGVLEASAIAAEMEKMDFSRPMTHDLIKDIIVNLKASVDRIEVVDLKDNVYYATIHMTSGSKKFKIDARPSDAIALSLRTDTEIFVDSNVLDMSRSVDMSKRTGSKGDESKNWHEILEDLSPEAFGKYKM